MNKKVFRKYIFCKAKDMFELVFFKEINWPLEVTEFCYELDLNKNKVLVMYRIS